MVWRTLAVVLIGLLCQMVSLAEDQPKTDEQRIQGGWDWDPAAPQSDAEPKIVLERVVIQGKTLTFHYRFNDKKFTSATEFKLNPSASPKEIDFTPTEGDNKGNIYLGLYELKAGKLRISYRGPGATRPNDFDDKFDRKTGSVTTFIVLKPTPAS